MKDMRTGAACPLPRYNYRNEEILFVKSNICVREGLPPPS